MAILRFFRLPKPKKFEYTPLYYDPKKEAMQERERRISSELTGEALSEEDYANRIKGSMRSPSKRKQKDQKSDARTSNIRIVLIILVLAFLAWYFILR